MKRILTLLLLAVMLLSLVSCTEAGVPEGTFNVAIENAKFNLYVPEGTWLSTASSGISGARYYSGTDFSNVTVTVYYPEDLAEIATAADYWEKKCLQDYTANFKNFTVLEDKCKDTTLGGLDAKCYVYEVMLEGDTTYRFMQVMTVKDTLVYTFTYTAKIDLYDSHLTDVEAMVANFTFR